MNKFIVILPIITILFLATFQANAKNVTSLTDKDITGFWHGEAVSSGRTWSSDVFFQLEAVGGKITGKEKFNKKKQEWKLNLTGYYKGIEIYLKANNGTKHHWELVKKT